MFIYVIYAIINYLNIIDHAFRLKVARDYINNNIKEDKKKELLWTHKLTSEYWDEAYLIRFAWAESMTSVIEYFSTSSFKKNTDINKLFITQIKTLSVIARRSLLELTINYGKEIKERCVPPVFDIEHIRYKSIKHKNVLLKKLLDRYFITYKSVKPHMEAAILKKCKI